MPTIKNPINRLRLKFRTITAALKSISALFMAVMAFISMQSCHESPVYKNDPLGNFNALWDIVDQRYCFFREKNINWDSIGKEYRKQITPETNFLQLFEICSNMLDELQDGHVNLTSSFSTSYYRKWWSDYPQDFNLRTVQQYYLDFDYYSTSGISYKMLLPDSIGYIYYPSFSYTVGETNLDYILAILHKSKGIILDIRDNGGGALTNIKTLVSRFIDRPVNGGYICHKTGPGHSDFSKPFKIEYEPADEKRIVYWGPIVLLTNRSCFSAANNFASVMKSLPNVVVAGARTGGGGGMPFSSEIPNGWSLRFSACPLLNADMESIEQGIEPTKGCEVHAPEQELAQGKDAIIDFAMKLLKAYFDKIENDKNKTRAFNPEYG